MTSQIPTGNSMSLHFTTPFRDLQQTDVLKSRISIPVLLPADPERPAMFLFAAYFRPQLLVWQMGDWPSIDAQETRNYP